MDPTWISDLADDLLVASAATYVGTGRSAPGRQSVVYGPPALDCEQLTVAVGAVDCNRPASGFTRPGSEACVVTFQATFSIWVARCVPTLDDRGKPPKTADETTAAHVLADDAAIITQGIAQALFDGLLLTAFTVDCRNVRWGSLQPVAPSGGLAAFSWPISFDRSTLRRP